MAIGKISIYRVLKSFRQKRNNANPENAGRGESVNNI